MTAFDKNPIEAKEIMRILETLESAAKLRSPAMLSRELVPLYQLALLERIAKAIETLGVYQGASGMMGLLDQMSGGMLIDAIKKGASDKPKPKIVPDGKDKP